MRPVITVRHIRANNPLKINLKVVPIRHHPRAYNTDSHPQARERADPKVDSSSLLWAVGCDLSADSDELDLCHFCAVAAAWSEFGDPRVATGSVCISRSDVVEKFGHDFVVLDLLEHDPA